MTVPFTSSVYPLISAKYSIVVELISIITFDSEVSNVIVEFAPYGVIVFVAVVPSMLTVKLFAPDASNVAVFGASVKEVAVASAVWRVSVVFVPYGCIVFVAVVPSMLRLKLFAPDVSNVAVLGASVKEVAFAVCIVIVVFVPYG